MTVVNMMQSPDDVRRLHLSQKLKTETEGGLLQWRAFQSEVHFSGPPCQASGQQCGACSLLGSGVTHFLPVACFDWRATSQLATQRRWLLNKTDSSEPFQASLAPPTSFFRDWTSHRPFIGIADTGTHGVVYIWPRRHHFEPELPFFHASSTSDSSAGPAETLEG